MIAMVSSAADLTPHRTTIAAYLKLLRKHRPETSGLLFHDMVTIRHQGRFLKTSYRKVMNRAYSGGHWQS